jgi:hypothetical protein
MSPIKIQFDTEKVKKIDIAIEDGGTAIITDLYAKESDDEDAPKVYVKLISIDNEENHIALGDLKIAGKKFRVTIEEI